MPTACATRFVFKGHSSLDGNSQRERDTLNTNVSRERRRQNETRISQTFIIRTDDWTALFQCTKDARKKYISRGCWCTLNYKIWHMLFMQRINDKGFADLRLSMELQEGSRSLNPYFKECNPGGYWIRPRPFAAKFKHKLNCALKRSVSLHSL